MKDVSELDTPKLTPRKEETTLEKNVSQPKETATVADVLPDAQLKASSDVSVKADKTNPMTSSAHTIDDVTKDDVYNTNEFDSESVSEAVSNPTDDATEEKSDVSEAEITVTSSDDEHAASQLHNLKLLSDLESVSSSNH